MLGLMPQRLLVNINATSSTAVGTPGLLTDSAPAPVIVLLRGIARCNMPVVLLGVVLGGASVRVIPLVIRSFPVAEFLR